MAGNGESTVRDRKNGRKLWDLVLSLRESAESAVCLLPELDLNAEGAEHRRGRNYLGAAIPALPQLGYLMKVRSLSVGDNGDLGFALREAGKLGEAIEAWRAAIAIDPNDPIAPDELQKLEPGPLGS